MIVLINDPDMDLKGIELIPEELKDEILLDKIILLKDRPELFNKLLTFIEEQYG
jgi:hypothetical protein